MANDDDDSWLYGTEPAADDKRAAAIAAIDADRDPTIKAEYFDKETIAALCGLPVYQISQAIKRGAPVHRRGSQRTPWQINLGDFMRWQVKDALGLLDDADATQASEYHSQKCRKMKADADRVEMDNAKKRAVTLTVDEVTTIYREEAELIRAELNALPGRAVEALAKLDADERRNASIVENVLDDEVQATLRRISANDGVANASACTSKIRNANAKTGPADIERREG
jgi:phage terminase Nu1 subunit (DNA packaging protein)